MEDTIPLEAPQKTKKTKDSILDFIQSIAIALAFSAFLFIFVITPNEVDGNSMQPNYQSGDRLYTNKLAHWFNGTGLGDALGLNYSRGDVVVVDKPGLGLSLIKRIIGLPGERIRVEDGVVFINGKKLEEPYLPSDTETFGATFLKEGDEYTIPENNYVVMGDNRKVSNDSRYIGFINKDWISGKIFLRIWPLEKLGIINSTSSSL
jgi:signal peptidase I